MRVGCRKIPSSSRVSFDTYIRSTLGGRMPGQRRHVTRRPDGQWADTAEGAQRAAGLHPTRAAAQAASTEHLEHRPGGGEVVIHRPTGRSGTRTRSTAPIPTLRVIYGTDRPTRSEPDLLSAPSDRRFLPVPSQSTSTARIDPDSSAGERVVDLSGASACLGDGGVMTRRTASIERSQLWQPQ
jgi:hypothetical protein